jgi:subtilisin family serine protease
MEVMDNKNIRNQTLGVFMKDTVLNLLASKIYGDNNSENIQKISKLNCSKPFYFLDSEDTISIGRNAKEVKVPQFWATLTIYLDEELRLKNFCESLNTMNPFVRFYDIIPKPELFNVPNDFYYQTKQKSLHFDSIYPDADINVEEAWDIETGKKFVRVGVVDTQIDVDHYDLELTDYYNLYSTDTTVINEHYHATRVAGIIGAKRNNSIGIAGIAGGNGNDTTGVTIFGIDILGAFTFHPQHSAVAIVLGSTQLTDANEISNIFPDYGQYFYATDIGLGLHIMNHSYGINYGSFIPNDPFNTVPTTCNICHEAIEYSFRNGVINVAARGNEFIGGYDNATDSVFPSCTKDEMILSVTSSGFDGLFKSYSNDNPDPLSTENYMSMYARNVDLMAPGTTANVYSTEVNDDSPDLYFYFNGTSAASPHVAGVAALMLSHVNRPCPCEKNLSNEDIENILQKTASERDYAIVNGTYINTPDYDSYSGWGMLDAGKALKAVEEPKNQIIHVTKQNASVNSTLVAQDAIIHLYNPYNTSSTGYMGTFSSMFDINQLFSGTWAMQNPAIDQSYVVYIYKVSTTIDHSSKTQHFSTNAEIKDYWIRNSNSIGWALDSCIHMGGVLVCDSIDVTQNIYFDTTGVDLNTASLFTYVYNFKHIYQDWDSVTYMTDLWYPSKPEGTEFAYSIYVHDSSATSVPFYPCTTSAALNSSGKLNYNNCNIFPNPVSEKLNLMLEIEKAHQTTVAIYDISGRKIDMFELDVLNSGKHYFDFNVSKLNSGIYFLQINAGEKFVSNKKFIKQ